MNKTIENEWVKYSYDINIDNFYNICLFLDNDMFGRLNKILSLLNLNNIVIDNVMIVDKNSRQYKINRFLSRNDDIFLFKYAKIEIINFENKYRIEFYKSKKGISTKLISLTKNNFLIKDEVFDDYRAQIKLLKNKLDKHSLNKDKIKSYVSEEIKNIKNDISDELEKYIINYFDKIDMKFYNINTELTWKNYFIVNLFIKKKNKILKIKYSFHKNNQNSYCYETYTVCKINSDYKKYNSYNEAYLDFISS